MKRSIPIVMVLIGLGLSRLEVNGQALLRDTVVYRYIYRDTIIYHHDTVRIQHFVYSDTVRNSGQKRRTFNPTSWGIGPVVGAYYSPYHGFDVNIGFGVQYFLFAAPTFRNPHMGARKPRKH